MPSGLGFVLFAYGKKQGRAPQMAAGLALMVYPYFATTVTSLTAVGVLITLLCWGAVRLGW